MDEADQLTRIWFKCEAQRQMHRLAHKHFDHLQFWLQSFPLILLTAASGIMAFLSSSEFFSDSSKQFLSLAVGVLSVVSVAWQQVGKICNYGTRAEMHKNAALGMKKITDNITFNQIDPDTGPPKIKFSSGPAKGKLNLLSRVEEDDNKLNSPAVNSGDSPPEISQDEIKKKEEDNLAATYRDLYSQCLESCNSAIPIHINQAFLLADSRLTMILNRRMTIKIVYSDMQGTRTMEFRQFIFGTTYNEVFCAITEAWCWPFGILNPNKAVKNALRNVKLTYNESDCFLNPEVTTPLEDGCFGIKTNYQTLS